MLCMSNGRGVLEHHCEVVCKARSCGRQWSWLMSRRLLHEHVKAVGLLDSARSEVGTACDESVLCLQNNLVNSQQPEAAAGAGSALAAHVSPQIDTPGTDTVSTTSALNFLLPVPQQNASNRAHTLCYISSNFSC